MYVCMRVLDSLELDLTVVSLYVGVEPVYCGNATIFPEPFFGYFKKGSLYIPMAILELNIRSSSLAAIIFTH